MNHEASRPIDVLGAASSIGIRPYDDDAGPRRLDLAPAALRRLGLVSNLGARDQGDVPASPYRDFTRPPLGIRNEADLVRYTRALAARVATASAPGRFLLVLGGDCSIVLGSLLGLTRQRRRVGLAYLDAHADFGTPQESRTGSAASMCLALAVGRGDSPLARLGGSSPLVSAEDVALVGRRDEGQSYYGHDALHRSGVLDIPGPQIRTQAPPEIAAATLARVARPELDGFWIHVDADLLDPAVMPAVDSPEPGGPGLDDLAALVGPLVRHPKALGMQLTIYDPALDPSRTAGATLVRFLCAALARQSMEA